VHLVSVNAPATYARQSIVLNVSSISVEDLYADGLKAHVVGEVSFNSSRVEDKWTRVFGRFATNVMRKAEVKETYMFISRVDEDQKSNIFGRASVPNIIVDIRDDHVTPIDFISEVEDIASVEEMAKLIDEYLEGKLGNAVFRGDADLPLRSGIMPLGTHHVAHEVKLQGEEFFIYFLLNNFVLMNLDMFDAN